MLKLDWHGLKVSPWDDIIDSRQIAELIEEIIWDHTLDDGEVTPVSEWSDSDREVHRVLSELMAELPDSADRDGVTLIRESHFTDHIRDESREIGPEFWEQDPNCRWEKLIRVPLDELYQRLPFSCIDWDAVAEEYRSDYSTVEFIGTTYYYQEP